MGQTHREMGLSHAMILSLYSVSVPCKKLSGKKTQIVTATANNHHFRFFRIDCAESAILLCLFAVSHGNQESGAVKPASENGFQIRRATPQRNKKRKCIAL